MRGVGEALEKHHNTSPDCAIVNFNSSLYLDNFAHLLSKTSPDVSYAHVP